jgi:hypothetical protein
MACASATGEWGQGLGTRGLAALAAGRPAAAGRRRNRLAPWGFRAQQLWACGCSRDAACAVRHAEARGPHQGHTPCLHMFARGVGGCTLDAARLLVWGRPCPVHASSVDLPVWALCAAPGQRWRGVAAVYTLLHCTRCRHVSMPWGLGWAPRAPTRPRSSSRVDSGAASAGRQPHSTCPQHLLLMAACWCVLARSHFMLCCPTATLSTTVWLLLPVVARAQVHPKHVRHVWRGPVRGPGLAVSEHRVQVISAASGMPCCALMQVAPQAARPRRVLQSHEAWARRCCSCGQLRCRPLAVGASTSSSGSNSSSSFVVSMLLEQGPGRGQGWLGSAAATGGRPG